jgi:hypothetical protein
MTPYFGVAALGLMAAFCFANAYYGFRFPEEYLKSRWFAPRGLSPEDPTSASAAATVALVLGLFFGAGGIAVLHSILAK